MLTSQRPTAISKGNGVHSNLCRIEKVQGAGRTARDASVKGASHDPIRILCEHGHLHRLQGVHDLVLRPQRSGGSTEVPHGVRVWRRRVGNGRRRRVYQHGLLLLRVCDLRTVREPLLCGGVSYGRHAEGSGDGHCGQRQGCVRWLHVLRSGLPLWPSGANGR